MKELQLFVKLIPLIIELMRIAEKFFNKENSGAEKKAAVIDGISAIFNSVENMSTGGQKETLETIKPLVSPAIDIFASQLYPKEEH